MAAFKTWGTGVNVRAASNTQSAVVATLDGPTDIDVDFQERGEAVTAEGHTNDMWAHVPALGGFVSNIYVDVAEAVLPGVPVQGGGTPPPPDPIGGLSKEQVGNAKTIIDTGRRHQIPEQGLVVAVATAMQESSLVNVRHGDRDSLGLFQQRPGMGWGTPEQIMDPVKSSEAFYGVAPDEQTTNPGLLQVDGWESMSVAQAAQAVQRSAFPDAYAKHEPLARELVAKL